MRAATLRTSGGTRAAIRVDDAHAWSLQPEPDVGTFLMDTDWRRRTASPSDTLVPELEAEHAPLVLRPGKILCVGLNYRSHIKEMGRELPAYPTLFTKFPEALVGARDVIRLPAESTEMDWEAELVVVVGSRVRRVSERDAHLAIAGYAVANDVTARDWQYRTTQWTQGKTFEATTPIGPELVTSDEVDGAADLRVRCLVDGKLVQDATTADLVFSPAALVAYVSAIVTLQPGDLLLTGTSGGVGHARQPAEYLSPGAVLTTEIDGIGSCVNGCVADVAAPAGGLVGAR